jgi:hypothetical protein
MNEYVAPVYESNGFNCPHCQAFAHQDWHTNVSGQSTLKGAVAPIPKIRFSRCQRCLEVAVWEMDRLVHPDIAAAPNPNPDIPELARDDYREAASVLSRSPKAAAALLRLALERIAKGLEPEGGNLNATIGLLVKKGLRKDVQQALDTVRVIGNHAVHPGQMDNDDDHKACFQLFGLVNLIVGDQISQPKRIQDMFGGELTPGELEQIERRDSASDTSQ